MTAAVKTHEGEVAVALDLADLLALVLVVDDLDIFQRKGSVLFLAGPFQGLGPGLVSEPVADEVGVTSVDEDRDLLKDAGDKTVVGLHPVTVEEEVAVDVKVAGVIPINFSPDGVADFVFVQVFRDVAHALVAKVALVLALAANIVHVLSGLLVRSKESIVTVDRRRDTDPCALAAVARFNHGLAAAKGVVHGAAGALVQHSRVTTITTGHGAVVFILGETISQSVPNQNRLQVDVTLLVSKNLRSENRDVVASIRFSSNMEVLLRILRELLEEESKQGVNVLASSNRVANSVVAVGVANVDRLVQEDHGSVGVP